MKKLSVFIMLVMALVLVGCPESTPVKEGEAEDIQRASDFISGAVKAIDMPAMGAPSFSVDNNENPSEATIEGGNEENSYNLSIELNENALTLKGSMTGAVSVSGSITLSGINLVDIMEMEGALPPKDITLNGEITIDYQGQSAKLTLADVTISAEGVATAGKVFYKPSNGEEFWISATDLEEMLLPSQV